MMENNNNTHNIDRQIDAVCFDFGNIFTVWNPLYGMCDEYAEGGFPRERCVEFLESDFWLELIDGWDGGNSHLETLNCVKKHDTEFNTNYFELFEFYQARFKDTIRDQVVGQADIVRELQKNGIKTYGITNWSKDDIQDAIDSVEAIGLMDGIVVSGIERVMKPSPEIYQIAIDRFNLDPNRTAFTDDKNENCEAFAKFGAKVLHAQKPYENQAPILRKWLESLGAL